ncbi:MAG: competence/damage-inducible protein A [Sulfurimonadaceae bacterium]
MNTRNIYAVIIGSEILNGRRVDKHFNFVKRALAERGYTLFCVEIIKDDEPLIKSSFERVLADKKSMLFCFGGIGSTPDDLTRAVAAEVFTSKPLVRHEQFEKDVIERFGEGAFPNRIHMSDLPQGSLLLKNPVNNMSGFYLDDRYFFVPGFPEMAHPMVREAIARFLPQNSMLYRKTLLARCSEEKLITIMKTIPEEIECSALPLFVNEKANVEMSVAAYDEKATLIHFNKFIDFLEANNISYEVKA